jgi:shikimate kinase
MDGRAEAPAAGTVLCALANGYGSAFAIDEYVTASVSLDGSSADTAPGGVAGDVAGAPEADTALIERCVELATTQYGDGQGGTVTTESDVPMASGLKSSSAAANATVLATLDALGVVQDVDRVDACRLGVQAARDVGVTVTGAFDDASASMLGGVTVTDNTEDELLARAAVDWDVLVWTPPEQSFSADADVSRARRVAPVADLVRELALDGRYEPAMTVNGFAFTAALDHPTAPMLDALPDADGVTLSGTGPSYVAVGDPAALGAVRDRWNDRPGDTLMTTTQTGGARPT